MTPEERVNYHKAEWRRQIISVSGDEEEADHIIQLAELNGLFDIHKMVFFGPIRFPQELLDRDHAVKDADDGAGD